MISRMLSLALAAALGAGYRVPLAGVMFVAEASGRPGFIVPGLLAAVGAGGDQQGDAEQRPLTHDQSAATSVRCRRSRS